MIGSVMPIQFAKVAWDVEGCSEAQHPSEPLQSMDVDLAPAEGCYATI